MDSVLQQQIAQAVRAGLETDEIEQLVIAPAPLDEEEKAALWLFAEVLEERGAESIRLDTRRLLMQA